MLVSIVVSVYNEQDGLVEFNKNLLQHLGQINSANFEIIWVNDGSKDDSQLIINQFLTNSLTNIINKKIEFSKNFGHEAAMIAGIDNATGDAIICMDSDNQHPPSIITSMIENYKNGSEIVLMRYSERDDSKWKLMASSLFYKITNFLSENEYIKGATDFFLITKDVADVLKKNYRNKTRFIRSFIQVIGFNKTVKDFTAPKREFGESKYSFFTLLKLAFNSVFFTTNSLFKVAAYLSFIFIVLGLIISVYTLKDYIANKTPDGFATIVLFLSISFSLVFLVLFIVCLYLSKLVTESRNEPIYIIKQNR